MLEAKKSKPKPGSQHAAHNEMIDGKEFKGGQFVPKDDGSSATPSKTKKGKDATPTTSKATKLGDAGKEAPVGGAKASKSGKNRPIGVGKSAKSTKKTLIRSSKISKTGKPSRIAGAKKKGKGGGKRVVTRAATGGTLAAGAGSTSKVMKVGKKLKLPTSIFKDASDRIIKVAAHLDMKYIGTGTAPSAAARQHLSKMGGKIGDEAGHIIAFILGGKGGKKSENILPIIQKVNRGEMSKLEKSIKASLEAGKRVSVKLNLSTTKQIRHIVQIEFITR